MADEDQYGISQSGLVARSPEGHAARGMQIKGNEDVWIEIQAHTFKNWVNEKLAPSGLMVEDLVSDLRDGVCLVTLVEILQQKKLRKISRPMNQHQWLENVTTALRAIEQDGIKLVNIGESAAYCTTSDIVSCWQLLSGYTHPLCIFRRYETPSTTQLSVSVEA